MLLILLIVLEWSAGHSYKKGADHAGVLLVSGVCGL